MDYEQLRDYLRTFVNIGGDPVPYDVNGVIHLWVALLDNLRVNALTADIAELGDFLSDEQVAFLSQLAEYAKAKSVD